MDVKLWSGVVRRATPMHYSSPESYQRGPEPKRCVYSAIPLDMLNSHMRPREYTAAYHACRVDKSFPDFSMNQPISSKRPGDPSRPYPHPENLPHMAPWHLPPQPPVDILTCGHPACPLEYASACISIHYHACAVHQR